MSMKLLLTIFIYLVSSTLFAQNIHRANVEANNQKAKELKENSLVCYIISASSRTTILDGYGFSQSYLIGKSRVEVNFTKEDDQLIASLNNDSNQVSFTLGNLNFRTTNIRLSTLSDELKDVVCYFGKSTFFTHYNDSRDFVIHNHIQSRFYGHSEDFIKWYWRFANGFKNYPNLILLDGPSNTKNYEITTAVIEANTKPYRDADLLTGLLKLSNYKTAPSGNIHISFGAKFQGNITIMGTAYNYCTTNLFLSIARALVSSKRNSLILKLPGFYNHFQEIGLNSDLNITFSSEFNDIRTLKNNATKEFIDIFNAQKELIEKALNYQVEILLKNQVGKTDRPKLVVDIY